MLTHVADSSERVRAAIAEALGRLGDNSTVDPPVAMANDPSSRVRMAAAGALGLFSDVRIVPVLLKLLSDDSMVEPSGGNRSGKNGA